ncbi:hypothetical protein DV515_00016439, partial [Chloebia gouldiae]
GSPSAKLQLLLTRKTVVELQRCDPSPPTKEDPSCPHQRVSSTQSHSSTTAQHNPPYSKAVSREELRAEPWSEVLTLHASAVHNHKSW